MLAFLNDFALAQLLRAGPGQIARQTAALRKFLWRQRVRTWTDINVRSVTSYLAGMILDGVNPKTVRNRRSDLSRFCEWARREGLLAVNPVRDVDAPPLEEQVPHYLTEAELQQALAVAESSGCWQEVAVAVASGLRLSELARLEWADVDLGRRILLVRKSKTRKARTVPLNELALSALTRQRTVTGLFLRVFPARESGWVRGRARGYEDRERTPASFIDAITPVRAAVAKFACLPGKSTGRAFHLLRHTFCSLLAQRGVSLRKIQGWAGHSDIRTTEIYTHLASGYDPAIEAAAFGHGPDIERL
ncbi:MAG: tyrosine-type recombinase/integrase [Candidatus Atribacteria bacterium]|nr:tyrosine-type recombinase/integrase [Candidatus Atribacteria bacterium]